MKKLFLSSVASVLALLAFPVAASALPAVSQVYGTVTSNGAPVDGANVTVTCNGNVQTDTTDNEGGYFVQFTVEACPNNATADVTASKDGNAGSNTGKLIKQNSRVNVAVEDVNIALPEMGLITGGIAAAAAGGAFMIIRRRHNFEQS